MSDSSSPKESPFYDEAVNLSRWLQQVSCLPSKTEMILIVVVVLMPFASQINTGILLNGEHLDLLSQIADTLTFHARYVVVYGAVRRCIDIFSCLASISASILLVCREML
jgi:hypothetical protein